MVVRTLGKAKRNGWLTAIRMFRLVLVLGIAASFIIAGAVGLFTGQVNPFAQNLAQVGSIKISGEAYDRELKSELTRLTRQAGGQQITLDDARKFGIDQQVFDRMVNGAVVDNQAATLGLSISDASIAADVADNPAFKNAQGQFDPARFRNILAQEGYTEDAFLAQERLNRIRGVMTSAAEDGITLPRTLAEALLRYRNESRDVRHFAVTVNDADVPAPSDAEIKAQYDATPAAYTAPEYRSIVVMKVEPADVAAKITINPEDVAANYEGDKDKYSVPEKRTVLQMTFQDPAKAKEAKAKLDSGQDFATLAKELGFKDEDIVFADKEKSSFIDAKIADAAFGLAENAISEPVQGNLAVAILKATKIAPARQIPLEEVKAEIEKQLQLNRAEEEIEAVREAVEDAIAGESKLEAIAEKAGLPITVIPALSQAGLDRSNKPVSLTGGAELLKAVYESDVGVDNYPLTLETGYLWYDVREVIPSALRPFDDVQEQAKQDVVAKKLRDIAAEKAKAVIAKAGPNNKFESLATEANATVQDNKGLKRVDTTAELDSAAIATIFGGAEGSVVWAPDGDGRSARIIEVVKVNVPPISAASADLKQVADVAKAGLGNDMSLSFIRAARANSDLTTNDALWQTIRGVSTQP